jgi:hypothetical protein
VSRWFLFFSFPTRAFCFLNRAASDAILPSALFVSDLSLGASWAYPFQQVLLPEYRPRLPSALWELGQDLVAVT